MKEKIKYVFSRVFTRKTMRIGCSAVMAVLTAAVITLLNSSIYTVDVSDGEKSYTVRTLDSNIVSVLPGLNLKSKNYRIDGTSLKGKNGSISISYTYPVYITCGENTVTVEFSGGTVADALYSAGFTLDEHDYVTPSPDTEITETVYIDYADVSYSSGSYTETIPFDVETIYSNDAPKGNVTTLQKGVNGQKSVSYTEKTVNGVSVEKTVTDVRVISAAVSQKNVVGTKTVPSAVSTSAAVSHISTLEPAAPIELDANGNPVNYKSVMTARATAYTYTGHNCATGVAPQPGYVAVNPKVIPYGTKLYIKTADGKVIYGYAVAADTGGFIKKYPNGVDLFMASKSACFSFGVRNVQIFILE